jgi:hypothetical protein
MEQEKPDTFAKEMQNDPVSGLNSHISRNDFRYWTIENNYAILFNEEAQIQSKYPLDQCKAAIACDLAWEEDKSSDFSVIMPGFLTPSSDLLIDTYICKKGLRPNEIYEILFSMETRLRSLTGSYVPIGFEKAKLEKVIKHLLRQEMQKRNHWLSFKDLAWDGDKIMRIITRLQPRYSQHSIFHRRGMGELEGQLVRLPNGTHDDLPDAAQGLVQLLKNAKHVKKEEYVDSQWDAIYNMLKDKKQMNNVNIKIGQFQITASRKFQLPAEKAII